MYLCGSLCGARGLRDLDLLDLDRVLTVAVGVMQLAHVDRLGLGVRGGGLQRVQFLITTWCETLPLHNIFLGSFNLTGATWTTCS